MVLREKYPSEIATILSNYAQKRSAVLPLLYIAQDAYGYLSDEAVREVADILDLPATDVFEVVGFYTLFYDRPVGQWILQVCDDVPCCFTGAEQLISDLEQKLGIQVNQTTEDRMFTLERVKCLAACDKAPLLQANLEYHYQVTSEKIDALIADLRQRIESGEKISISGRLAER